MNDEYAIAKRRMLIVVFGSFFFGLVSAGSDLLFPLYATSELGMSASVWAFTRSVRFWGVFAGILIFGLFSEKFGQKRTFIIGVFMTAVSVIFMGTEMLWLFILLMPFFGLGVSNSLVSFNVFTQLVSEKRQGLANTLYRSTATLAGIIGAGIFTWLMSVLDYSVNYIIMAGILILTVAVIMRYPDQGTELAPKKTRRKFSDALGIYKNAFANKRLMTFIHVSLIYQTLLFCWMIIIPVRMTVELGMDKIAYGKMFVIGGIFTFVISLIQGAFIDRIPVKSATALFGILAGAIIAMHGFTDSVEFTYILFVLCSPLFVLMVSPSIMWLARIAGKNGLSSALAVHKVFGALYAAVIFAGVGELTKHTSLKNTFIVVGILGGLSSVCLFLLKSPPVPEMNKI